MTVLIVVESSFGNTMAVAEALAAALRGSTGQDDVTVVQTDDAPGVLPPGVDLLLVGAPTHAFTLPTPKSREQAARKGAFATTKVGVREWIEQLAPRPDLPVQTFDTSIRMRLSLGCAAKATCRLLVRRGFAAAERGPSFYVTDTAGPLADGERQRAGDWAEQLAARRLQPR